MTAPTDTTTIGVRPAHRNHDRHRRYGLTCDEYEELRRLANYACQVCGADEDRQPTGVLCIDHDATVGPWAVRGLLCNRCNSALDMPALAGASRDAYLSRPWFAAHPERPVSPPTRPHRRTASISACQHGRSALLDLTAQLSEIDREIAALRARAAELVVELLKADQPPTEIARMSPFSDAHVRTLARVAGIPPARRGRK